MRKFCTLFLLILGNQAFAETHSYLAEEDIKKLLFGATSTWEFLGAETAYVFFDEEGRAHTDWAQLTELWKLNQRFTIAASYFQHANKIDHQCYLVDQAEVCWSFKLRNQQSIWAFQSVQSLGEPPAYTQRPQALVSIEAMGDILNLTSRAKRPS